MTRKELNGYIRYKQEIKLLETELEEMKNTDADWGMIRCLIIVPDIQNLKVWLDLMKKSMKIEKRDLTSEFVKFGKLRTGSRKLKIQKSD